MNPLPMAAPLPSPWPLPRPPCGRSLTLPLAPPSPSLWQEREIDLYNGIITEYLSWDGGEGVDEEEGVDGEDGGGLFG